MEVLQLLLLLAKLKLLASSHGVTLALISSFLLKIALRAGDMQRVSRYAIPAPVMQFLFQLNRIFSDLEPGRPDERRWERAFRLVCERLRDRQQSPPILSDHSGLHAVFMASL
ncbi:hypothetical protein Scep_026920 [Stephania cephalantha]|uniref:Uncharacterized protein n=1 Tax=Stephania cephalantha TaxID=152367 RepID=A0AAP0EL17_9MAGN